MMWLMMGRKKSLPPDEIAAPVMLTTLLDRICKYSGSIPLRAARKAHIDRVHIGSSMIPS
jgi:hypothetical protein